MIHRLTTFRACFALVACLAACSTGEAAGDRNPWNIPFEGQSPEDLFTKLDLGRPGLEAVSLAVEEGDRERAFRELLHYFRKKYPPKPLRATTAVTIAEADGVCRHEFFWEPYGSVDYGEEVNWEQDPVDDIQWVFRMYRFHWARSLEQAYIATRDEKYVQAFVELTTDWIRKHPLDDWAQRHYKYMDWWGFAWRELQTGLRASHMSSALISMIHSEAVTPEFVATVLASLYDHQTKTARLPMKALSNKAVAEQRGVLAVCVYFPEFKDTQRWVSLAIERSVENIMGQVTPDGVQREWCGGYHKVVMQDGLRLIQQADQLGVTIPDEFRERVRNMGEYLFAMATPDLGWPMFGDCGRADPIPEKRGDMTLHHTLNRLSGVWEDPKFSARASLDRSALPGQTSYAFHDAGMFVMRSDWGPENIYFALHCAPPPLNRFHDQPDNGTFELYAFGRWLMTDSGYYIYGEEHEDRWWHRQTSVHQTLTLDRQNSKIDGRLLLWHTSPEFDAAVVENRSYEGLLHRRSVWFVKKEFFLMLDEAVGNASGTLRLHWQPAAGPAKYNETEGWIETVFPDSNVRIETLFPHSPRIEEEEGWYAWTYGKRVPRKAFYVQHPEAAPAMFLTCVIPYRGTTAQQVQLVEPPLSEPGAEAVEIRLRYSEKLWRVGRNLEKGTAWCNEGPRFTGLPDPPPRGLISARDGQLVDAHGDRIRFWGVNIVPDPTWSYAAIEQTAHRIRQMGYNAVRLHLYDLRLFDPDAVNEHGEPTSRVFREAIRGDGSPLDKFDYLVYRLEREGLYLYLTGDRRRLPFRAGDYRILSETDAEDRARWQKATEIANEEVADKQLPYVDRRMFATWSEYVRKMLDHANLYTGIRTADDPWVAIWELTNENRFVADVLEGTHREWDPYWQEVLRKRLAEWLLDRYGSELALIEAWGRLEEGEGLADATIDVEPLLDNRADYPERRVEDITRFIYDLFIEASRFLEAMIQESRDPESPMAVAFNTIWEHKHPLYYTAAHGNSISVGTYPREGVLEGKESTLLSRHPHFYNLNHATVADKVTMVYETNLFKPAPYRAAYPLRVAALAGWQDWDAVFWYIWTDGTVPNQEDPKTYVETGLRYEVPSHTWHGVVICTDEMLLAGSRLAGDAFINFHLPVAEDPVRVTIGANDLFNGPIWVGDIDLPIPEGTRGRWPRAGALGATLYRHGLVHSFDPTRSDTTSTRPLIPANDPPLTPHPLLTYDWEKPILLVDSPGAKIAAGFFDDVEFTGGIRVQMASPEFAVIGVVSQTPGSLADTPQAVLVATSTGENTGAVIEVIEGESHAEAIKNWGTGPIQARRIYGEIRFPVSWDYVFYDFLLSELREGTSTSIELAGDPLFIAKMRPASGR